VRGIDNREVRPEREAKSVGAEDTFPYDLTLIEEMYTELEKIAKNVAARLSRYQLKGRTITLKIKYHDFKLITRSRSFTTLTDDENIISTTAKDLLAATNIDGKKIRLLGISLSNFKEVKNDKDDNSQLELF
jgi:DNA polymerase-4